MTGDGWQQLVEGSLGGPVTLGTMFGCRGLRTGRKFYAIWWHDQLVAKLPADRRQELVDAGHAEPFEPMDGRPMNGWVIVHPSVDWPPLADEARTWVESQQ